MTLYSVMVERNETQTILIEAPDLRTAADEAMELAPDLEWEHSDFYADPFPVPGDKLDSFPSWRTYWTGGPDGEFRELRERDAS